MAKQAPKKRAVRYLRVSSRTNKDRAGFARQRQAVAKSSLAKVVSEVAEVVSGSLPLDKWITLVELLKNAQRKRIDAIVVERTPALSHATSTSTNRSLTWP